MIWIKMMAFVVATAGMVYVSRASLAVPRAHGFYRFFASESILALALLNADSWFRDPLSWHQLTSWCLLAISVFLVVHAVRLLKQIGKPNSQRNETALIGFERTTALVTAGAYQYIRHPMYSSLFFLAWGIFFKTPSWLDALLSVVATLLLVATARVEEAENIRFFGSAYQAYMQQTKMFIPFLF
jgi:protein-S-isoprenylcysteine O-methyltransferase Ste14